MSHLGKGYDINQTFVIEPVSDSPPVYSACTGFYTDTIISCSGNTGINLGTDVLEFIGGIYTDFGVTADTINATTFYSGGTDLSEIITNFSITGGTFDKGSETLTLYKNNGNIIIDNFSDYYTTAATLFNKTVYFDRVDALSAYTLDLNSLSTQDTYVTGGTYSAGTAVFTNNTGGTFSVSGFSQGTSFTGGTVTGATQFTGGLSADTLSASTYLGLPLDVYVTGATYNNNIFTFFNNTGGTFSVQFNTLSGLTVSGTLVTDTISATTYQNLPIGDITRVQNGLNTYTGGTANEPSINISGGTFDNITVTGQSLFNSLSATTYLGLPIDIRVTGGTYSNGTAVFANNTGGTFSVSGFSQGTSFTGGTVTGATTFTNSLSAATYLGLPIDIRVTGGTYLNGSTIFTNNTGGTFTVSGYYTGGIDVFVTGGTFNKNTRTATYTNNSGGTFNVSGFTDITISGGSYSNSASTLSLNNNTGGTITVSGITSKGCFGLTAEGLGGVVSIGSKGYVIMPCDGYITEWRMVADTTGSTVIDVYKNGSTIIGAGNKPTLTNQKRNNALISGWTTSTFSKNDEFEFYINSASTITRLNIFIDVIKTN